ncbi:MAG: putative endonuclease [Candidatus Omnitrophota bacterium]|jgi:putative endonuclease
MAWYVYLLQCKDASLYTGITTDIVRRVKEHNAGKGSKAVRAKLPAKLVYSEKAKDRSEASKRECEIKQISREDKLVLIGSKI